MSYCCPNCKGALFETRSFNKEGSDYGGAYLTVIEYTCTKCGHKFKQVIKENFGGMGGESWYQMEPEFKHIPTLPSSSKNQAQ